MGSVKRVRPEIWFAGLDLAAQMAGHILVVQGAVDASLEGSARVDELAAAVRDARVEAVYLEGGDHYFTDRHAELAGCVDHGSRASCPRRRDADEGTGEATGERAVTARERRAARIPAAGPGTAGDLRSGRRRRGRGGRGARPGPADRSVTDAAGRFTLSIPSAWRVQQNVPGVALLAVAPAARRARAGQRQRRGRRICRRR